MKKFTLIVAGLILVGCDDPPSADKTQQHRQEVIQQELAAKMGMPDIKNGSEMRTLKRILEQRDQNRATYTYAYSEHQGKFRFIGHSIGFAIPYATQYTSPSKAVYHSSHGYITLPQADPNGLFSPASAEGSWILMKDPKSDAIDPQYFEIRLSVMTFKLPDSLVLKD